MQTHEIKGTNYHCDGSRKVPQVVMNADKERIPEDWDKDFREEA